MTAPPNNLRIRAARRKRVSHQTWCGEARMNSRRGQLNRSAGLPLCGLYRMNWLNKILKGRANADHRSKDERVAIYNFDRQEVLWIAARDLPAGLLQAQMEGLDHPVWVDPARLGQGEYHHPPFSPEVRDLFAQLKLALDEVYPRTIDEWEDGFRQDRNPEQEIAIWLHIAEVYKACTFERPLSLEAKQDYLRVLLACSTGPRDLVLQSVTLSTITEADAAGAINSYFVAPEIDIR